MGSARIYAYLLVSSTDDLDLPLNILGDESFDFGAMGRIFCGLCQVGAWGCFDEFNRLEERILSAVSQQILTIQHGLLQRQERIELLGRSIRLHDSVGIFVTMNPGTTINS